jgi:putative FmdB family regulatory protein
MPTYEYICSKCNHQFELSQSIKEKAIEVCPKHLCGQTGRWGKGKVKRAISAGAGLIFKGSGFYITDYRSEKYKEAAKKDVPQTATATDAKSTSPKTEPKSTPSTSAVSKKDPK